MMDTTRPDDLADFARNLRAKLADSPDEALAPEHLADLARIAYATDPHAAVVRHELQRDLFRRTVRHAVRTTEHYASRPEYPRFLTDSELRDRLDVSALPVLRRADVSEATARFLARDSETAWISHTAGSTGDPVSIHRSTSEVKVIQGFFRRMADVVVPSLPSLPLVLSLPNVYHGVATPVPSIGKVLVAGVTDDVLIKDAVRVLRAEYDLPGHDRKISIISGLGFHVAFLTSYLFEQGIDPATLGVKGINVTGAFVPKAMRRFLERAWGATLFDKFTLTEVFGGATRSGLDAPFRLDPFVFAEVLDSTSLTPIREGVGHLVLTSLYPFVQRQPIIRYETGDLVRVREHTPTGLQAFDFLGKIKNCVSAEVDGARQWLLCSADLYQALAKFPDVRLYEWFSNVRSAFDCSVGSQPIFVVKKETLPEGTVVIEVDVELRYAPHCHPVRVKAIEEEIMDDLRRTNPAFERLSREGRARIVLRFRSPGALGDQVKFKV